MLVYAVHRLSLQISIVASGNQVLSAIGIGERKPLHVKVELQHLRSLATESAHRDPNRPFPSRTYLSRDFNAVGLAARNQGDAQQGGKNGPEFAAKSRREPVSLPDSARSVWSASGLPALSSTGNHSAFDSVGKPGALHTLRAIRLRLRCCAPFASLW